MLMNMADLLAVANEHNFAVPAFNVSSNMLLKGVMHTCEEMQAPVIIAIHPDELEFVEDSFVKAVIEEAHKATVPVCVHLRNPGWFHVCHDRRRTSFSGREYCHHQEGG